MRVCEWHRPGGCGAVRAVDMFVGRNGSFIVVVCVAMLSGVQRRVNINCILKINNTIYLLRPTPSEVGVLRLMHCLGACILSCFNVLVGVVPVVPLLVIRTAPACRARLRRMPGFYIKSA